MWSIFNITLCISNLPLKSTPLNKNDWIFTEQYGTDAAPCNFRKVIIFRHCVCSYNFERTHLLWIRILYFLLAGKFQILELNFSPFLTKKDVFLTTTVRKLFDENSSNQFYIRLCVQISNNLIFCRFKSTINTFKKSFTAHIDVYAYKTSN